MIERMTDERLKELNVAHDVFGITNLSAAQQHELLVELSHARASEQEAVELLMEMLDLHHTNEIDGDCIDAMGSVTAMSAMRYLVRVGKLEIIEDGGNRVIGRWKKPKQEGA